MKRLCTICARGGSKGVKNKNILEIAGKPLIAHTILQAKESGLFDYIAVSSDSDAILETAKEWGADFVIKRPDELATDTAGKLPAIQHAVKTVEELTDTTFETLVDLDATSPLRDVSDIVGSVELLETNGVSNVITAAPARRSPYFNLVELNDNGYVHLSKKLDKPVVRRQDAPKCYDMNASIYVWQRESLFADSPVFQADTMLFEMPEERSVDIDSELDFKIVELLLTEKVARV